MSLVKLLKLTFVFLLLLCLNQQIFATNHDKKSDPSKCSRILLNPGDEYLGYYKCTSCQTVNLARPNAQNRQTCVNCGNPHDDKEGYIEPKLERVGNDLYLLEPDTFIKPGDKVNAVMGNGPVWICPNCSSTNFDTQANCQGCASPREAKAKVFEGDKAPVKPVSRAKDLNDANYKELDKQKRTIVIAAIVTPVVLTAVISFWAWAVDTYRAVGVLHSEANGVYRLDYEYKGRHYTKHLKPAGTINVPIGANGEHGVIHLKNVGGVIGVERDNGDVFVPTGND